MPATPRLIQLSSALDHILFDDYDPRAGQRSLLGPGATILIHGQKGKRIKGALRAEGRNLWEGTKGEVAGGGLGAGLGAGLGTALALRHGNLASLGKLKRYAGLGAGLGGGFGAIQGARAGTARGTYGKEADKIYRKSTGQLSSKLDSILTFDQDDDEDKKHSLLKTAAIAGVGAGGVLAHQAIQRTGGYAANANRVMGQLGAAKAGLQYGLGSIPKPGGFGQGAPGDTIAQVGNRVGQVASKAGQAVSNYAPKVGSAISSLWGKIAANAGKLKGLVGLSAYLRDIIAFEAIAPIKKRNKGKLTKTEEETGKSAEELKHSKNPKTRKRANFAVNAKKWHHEGRKSRAAALSAGMDHIIAFKAIDLGYTYDSGGCSPCGETSAPTKKHYPSLYISDRDKELNLPLSGEAKVKFRLRGKTARTDDAGKTKHSADIEIQSIDPVSDDKKPKEGGKAKLLGLDVSDEELIEFGKAGRLGALAAILGTLTASTAEHGKALQYLRGAAKSPQVESHVAATGTGRIANKLDDLQARSQALATEKIDLKKRTGHATTLPPTTAEATAPRQATVVARDSAREDRDVYAKSQVVPYINAKGQHEIDGKTGKWKMVPAFSDRASNGDLVHFSTSAIAKSALDKARRSRLSHLAIGAGSGYWLGRSFHKKKTDQGSVPGDSSGSVAELSACLDAAIAFGRNDVPPPEAKSWNLYKRYGQHKTIREWVKNRDPSAGLTAEQLEKKYPGHPRRALHIAGELAGGVAGGALGLHASSHLPGKLKYLPTVLIGTGLGGAAGRFATGPKSFLENFKQHRADLGTLKKSFKEDSVPSHSIKSGPAPLASTYGQVAGELKKQNVGFLKRHAIAVGTTPIRHMKNAAFIPEGDKGLVVTPKKVPRSVAAHEQGHAKDYAHYGGRADLFKATYPHYGQGAISRKVWIHNTMLPEERAWKHAKVKSKKDRDIQNAALGTYKRAGWLSSALDDILEFGSDPRGRNKLGEFSGQQESGVDPNAANLVYQQRRSMHQGIAEGAAAGIGGGAGVQAVKSLFQKIRRARK